MLYGRLLKYDVLMILLEGTAFILNWQREAGHLFSLLFSSYLLISSVLFV